MRFKITDSDYDELWQAAIATGKMAKHAQRDEWKISGNHQLGQESIWKLVLRPDLFITVWEFTAITNFDLKFRHPDCLPLLFSFQLSGKLAELTSGIHDDYCLSNAGDSYFLSVAGTQEIERYIAGENIICLDIWIAPDYLRALTAADINSLPAIIRPLIERDVVPPLYQSTGSLTLAMRTTLQQILNCPLQGVMKRIYLESKALELIALQLTELARDEQQPVRVTSQRQTDCDLIYHARDLLIDNLDHPPSLSDLATQVNLSDFTLKRRFRETFGTTVFGYLHQYRMEQARNLLTDSQMTITGVAQAIGYTNISAFGRAFRKQFGICPRQYLKDRSV
jgi:AraC family transcriptional regulator, transcriptional activator of the genes for pyochelin and ferripyochelin receptors